MVVFTTGSTAIPKAVLLPHRLLVRGVDALLQDGMRLPDLQRPMIVAGVVSLQP